ncbi:hypothetical protein [Arthrobacter sp. 35W]|uniref:hypothetical protein n=1 Tax=Arthrobacter sp. 35W TaxID=1132441 RepID=UPI00040A3585|nr:hypothetical protein [Arthrobacter sp. 35W]
MAELSYRPWRDGDDLALNEIWGDPETFQAGQFRGALAVSQDAGPWRRTIVAEDQGIAVAAGVVYSTALHAERLWVYVEVARDHRGTGLAATLLAMLRAEAAAAKAAGTIGTTALRTKVEPGTAGAAFAARIGLAPLQRSRVVVVSPNALRLPVFGEGTEAEATERVQDLATGSVELTDVVGRYYEAVHAWDPTGPLSPGTVQRLFLDDLTGAHGAIVLRAAPESSFGASVAPTKKGRVQAFVVSYTQGAQDAPTDVFVGHEPALAPAEAADAVRDLLALIAHQHPVVLELDESMTALRAVVEPLLEAGKASVRGVETLVVGES